MGDFNNNLFKENRLEADANYMAPFKRPRSAMCPLIIVNATTGNVRLITGAAGGSKILMATAYVAGRVLFFNETIKEATDALRIYNLLVPDVTKYEEGFPEVRQDKTVFSLAYREQKLV